jgi:hypothetical protein
MVMEFLQSDYQFGGLPPESAAGAESGARGELDCRIEILALFDLVRDPGRGPASPDRGSRQWGKQREHDAIARQPLR